MHGKRLRPPTLPVRLALGLVSVALLALASFPVLAQATDAAEVEYRPDPLGPCGEDPCERQPQADKSNRAPNGGANAPNSGGPKTESPAEGSSEDKGGGVSPRGGDGGTGQGSPGAGPGKKKGSELQSGNQLAAQQDDDDSSPLIPILIAILVLAAISIAVVMIRQRRERQGAGTPVSPKAS